MARFATSVVSFPERGVGGNPRYRGNWGPSFVEQMLATYYPGSGLVVDPMQGSGTTGDVCKRLGFPYAGSDLRTGFDAATDDLLGRLRLRRDDPVSLIAWHPPYAGMIEYSKDPRDLSAHGTDIAKFADMVGACMRNFAGALADDGLVCVLTANWRKAGTYYRLSTVVEVAAEAAGLILVDEVIKQQHSCSSDGKVYASLAMPRIMHETLLVFRKPTGLAAAKGAAA